MICVCFCALRRVKVNHQCAASPQNDSTLAPLRCWRSRLGDSKNSLIIAKAAARGDCGASLSNPLPNRIDDGDFATIISSCPGDISSIGFGDGASHSSNSTLPPESTDRAPPLTTVHRSSNVFFIALVLILFVYPRLTALARLRRSRPTRRRPRRPASRLGRLHRRRLRPERVPRLPRLQHRARFVSLHRARRLRRALPSFLPRLRVRRV